MTSHYWIGLVCAVSVGALVAVIALARPSNLIVLLGITLALGCFGSLMWIGLLLTELLDVTRKRWERERQGDKVSE